MTGDCCVPATRGPGPRLVPSARCDRSLKKILSDPHDFQSPYATILHRRDRTSQVLSDGCYNDCCDRWRLVSSDRIPTIVEPFFFFAAIGVHHMYQMETSFHLISCSFQQLEKALAGQYIFACNLSANV